MFDGEIEDGEVGMQVGKIVVRIDSEIDVGGIEGEIVG
jgi:hypothetical protein